MPLPTSQLRISIWPNLILEESLSLYRHIRHGRLKPRSSRRYWRPALLDIPALLPTKSFQALCTSVQYRRCRGVVFQNAGRGAHRPAAKAAFAAAFHASCSGPMWRAKRSCCAICRWASPCQRAGHYPDTVRRALWTQGYRLHA